MHGRSTLIIMIVCLVLLTVVAGLQSVVALSQSEVTIATTTVMLEPVKDNSMYEEYDERSFGQGQYLFAGKTGQGFSRRALIEFDIASEIPADALILSATLRLYASMSPDPRTELDPFTIHRLTADWGEGASDVVGPGGIGAPAQEGDATWSFAFYSITPTNLISWTNPGGDFDPAASASQVVGAVIGSPARYDWGPSPAMNADLTHWLRFPDENHGWLLMGDESELMTARRFESRENEKTENRPVLYVEYLDVRSRVYLPVVIRN